AGVECIPHAAARGGSPWGFIGISNVERCDQRGHARLGHQRADHALFVGKRIGGTSVSDDGAGLSSGNRARSAGADSEGGRETASGDYRVRWRRIELHWRVLRVY